MFFVALHFTIRQEKGFLNTDEFGVSVMASFGYRDQEITPKVRWNKEAIYEVIE